MNKAVRFLLFFLCSIAVLLVLITLLLPSTGRVAKEKQINARKHIVWNELTNVRNYTLWYPWLQMDPGVKVNYLSGGKDFSWISHADKNSTGTYEITSTQGDSIINFRFTYGNTPPVTGAYILRSTGDTAATTLIWYMNMESGWTPWWRFYGAMMDKLNGPLLETGLTNLKIICEKQMLLPEE